MLIGLTPNINIILSAIEKVSKLLQRDFGEIQQLQNSYYGSEKFAIASKKKAENILIKSLTSAKPTFGYFTQAVKQQGKDPKSYFIINTIDGYENYRKGIPYFATSITFQEAGQIVAGVVYNPITDTIYYAEKGGGAFMSEGRTSRRMRCGNKLDLRNAYILISGNLDKAEINNKPNQMKRIFDNINIVPRIFGSTSLDLANFADNRVDAFIGYNESILSASAGLLLAKESGAFMSGYNVKNEELKDELFYTDYLIVSNQKLKAELEEFIKKA